jgi:hypothetical protein
MPHFEAALRLHPNRTLSVLGLARAAAAAGETAIARQRYQELLTNYDRADDGLPEPAEARAALERLREPKRVDNRPLASIALSIAIVGAAATTMFVLRGRLARTWTRRKKR